MQVITPNNVKIYNLSAGKSLPDWISDRKKRSMLKKDHELRDRIELLQDFEMPIVSNCVKMSPDGQYIYATGVYKPRVRCFDTTQLSMKFERCFDSECVKFKILSDDYSKCVFLLNDRYVEFHAQYGKYYKTRVPKFGNDFDYYYSKCDLYFASTSNEIYRLNLEQGKYMPSLISTSIENTCCQFNPIHDLFVCGNIDGYLECWDPRVSHAKSISLLNVRENIEIELDSKIPMSVTSLKYRDGLHLAVGTSSGHVLLYDIRSNKPYFKKDHRYELPIKDIEWHDKSDNIISMDKRVCKIWNRHNGKPFTSIEPGNALNNLCLVKDTGMLFMANEAPKVLVYYIPSLGQAPKWCSFLDNLTEELETSSLSSVYDDYKFVTSVELNQLGLSHLIGSNVLKAYMHGYFMDIRLYNKAKTLTEPFNYEEFKKNKIRDKLEKSRSDRVKVAKKLPNVNKELAIKYLDTTKQETTCKKKIKLTSNPMEDSRFEQLFNNPDYQINMNSEEFKLLNPVVQKLNEKNTSKSKKSSEDEERNCHHKSIDELEGVASSEEEEDDDDDNDTSESSSDDEHTYKRTLKKSYNQITKEKKQQNYSAKSITKQPKFYEIKDEVEYFNNNKKNDLLKNESLKKIPLANRIQHANNSSGSMLSRNDSIGNKQVTFIGKKRDNREKLSEVKAKEHHQERSKLRRSAGSIIKTFKKSYKNYVKKK